MTTTDLQVIEQHQPTPTLFGTEDPAEIVRLSTARAKVLASVIRERKLYASIRGNDHVLVEGWTLLGSLMGVFPVCVWTRPIEGGWEARVEARTLSGATVGASEAHCTRAEKTWAGRDDFALRSMAQTRATSKALRLPLGYVMQLAGYNPTPAEEMVEVEGVVVQPAKPPAARPQQQPQAPRQGFKAATEALGYDWDFVLGQSQLFFENREPAQLTVEERGKLVEMLIQLKKDEETTASAEQLPFD